MNVFIYTRDKKTEHQKRKKLSYIIYLRPRINEKSEQNVFGILININTKILGFF